ncbi:MAG TPA: peptidyl-prolyl cis-trans isomerase [Solirubrobacterales bacterium]|nr:peptidyl-prolyl cis-trans isomerase [Solirubrobacterales bacterium]
MGAKSGRNKRGGRGGPKKSGAPQSRRSGGSSSVQRLGLVLFAVVFIVLFVVFAVAEGLGAPSVPSGDIALVTGVPSEIGHISEADYKKSLARQEKGAGLKKPPKAGSKKAEELHEATVGELVQKAWIRGEGEELGIEVTEQEVEKELAKIKKESFGGSKKKYEEFLKEQNFDEEEVRALVEINILQTKIQEKIPKEAPPVSEAEVKAKYEAEEATTYTKKPSRDVRVIVNENKKEVEAAKKALEADNSEAGWKKATKKYSPTTAAQAGLQKEISEEFLTEPLKKDIFKSATGELVGPVKQEKNYLLLEVVKLHPEKTQPFSEVKSTISSQLTQEKEQAYFTEWVQRDFEGKWSSRTHCASGFVVAKYCANYKGSGHPAEASEACYEANPKTPAKECPAPVVQNKPALPGSVTIAKPEGERLAQRPRPEEASKEAGAAAEGAAGAEGAGAEGSAETEAAQKAAEEAAAKAAAESAAKESGK